MPELELRRDPIGANRGKSATQHAQLATSRAKTHYHNKYYIPPYRPTNRQWEITFASLGFNRKTIEKFWRLFCRINHSSGAIQLEHFLRHFRLEWTHWTERCFKYFDTTGGGDVDFLEFMITVWNVCTFKIDSLSNFAFGKYVGTVHLPYFTTIYHSTTNILSHNILHIQDMYDLDSDGELSMPEIERMVWELFGREGGGKKCLASAIAFAEARGGALNLNAFIAFTSSHQLLLFPMFQLQQKLQRKVFGIRYWKKIERASKEDRNELVSEQSFNFNPRHVQNLLRTYQTGGAAAAAGLSGTNDTGLGKALREDWQEAKAQMTENKDIEAAGVEAESNNVKSRWNLIRESVVGETKAVQQWSSVRKGILDNKSAMNKIKQLKPKVRVRRKVRDTPGSDEAQRKADNGNMSKSPDPPEIDTKPSGTVQPPNKIADDLKRIRERRHRQAVVAENTETDQSEPDTEGVGPASSVSIPTNVADDLRRIRARRARKANRERRRGEDNRPTSKSSNRKRADHGRANRKKSNNTPTLHQNVRQRAAGSMFISQTKGRGGWLEQTR